MRIQQLIQQIDCQQNKEIFDKFKEEEQSTRSAFKSMADKVLQKHIELQNKLTFFLRDVEKLKQQYIDQTLMQWKKDQKLAAFEVPFNNNLDQIQEWCNLIAEAIRATKRQMHTLLDLSNKFPLNRTQLNIDRLQRIIAEEIPSLLSNLISGTFIIEKQPAQIIRINTSFSSTVRMLVSNAINVHMTPPVVKVSIINELKMNSIDMTNQLEIKESSFDIINNDSIMEYNNNNQQLTVHFKNSQLKKIKRAEKKGNECVMEEKFYFLFQSQVKVGELELIVRVLLHSLLYFESFFLNKSLFVRQLGIFFASCGYCSRQSRG